MTRASAGLSLLAVVLLARPATAQLDPAQPQVQTPAPAHLAVIDGAAWLERQSRAEPAPANMPLVAGDRLRTERGRVEVLFGDGSLLHLDQFTTVDFQSDALLRLIAGRLRVIVPGLDPNNPDEQVAYRIDTPGGSVRILTVGDYRVSLVGAPAATDVELAVLRGSADLATDLGAVNVSTGERSLARVGAPPSYPAAFNSARWDAFDRWSEERREARLGVASTQYLPAPLGPYASTFDHHGHWRHHPTYGDVWYPRVAVGWRPYYDGNWSFVGTFGWTWIGYDPWAWPTHHYGRWGFSAGLWFWIPGVRWGPAWVSWAWSPGYVGWCPLGYDGWPVFAINTFYAVNAYGRAPYSPGHGWSVVHADAFSSGHVAVARHGVAIEGMHQRVRAAFATQPNPPAPRGLAAPRPAPAIRAVGDRSGFAVPRRPAGAQAMPRSSAATVPSAGLVLRAPSSASATGDRRAVARAPLDAGGLGAPPRVGPNPGGPGLGSVAGSGTRGADQAREPAPGPAIPRRLPAAGRHDPSTTPVERGLPRRAPESLAAPPGADHRAAPWPERDPGAPRARPRTPSGVGPGNEAASTPRRATEPRPSSRPSPPARIAPRPREYESPAPRRAPGPPTAGAPERGRAPVMREGPSAPRGGGGVERSAPPRAPSGAARTPGGPSPGSAPGARRGGPAGTAIRRGPG